MDLPETSGRPDGLAWAVAFPPDVRPVAGEPRPPGQGGWDWLHYDLVHSRARAAIEAEPVFPPFALRLLTGTDETPRIVSDGEAVAGVLPSFARTSGPDQQEIVWWRFAMLPGRLITARRRPMRSLADVWSALRTGPVPGGPMELLDGAITDFARDARRRVAALEDSLDSAEDTLLDRSLSADLSGVGPRFGLVRRDLTDIKRALTPLVRLLDEDAEELPAWAKQIPHDAARTVLVGALEEIAALHDRARALQDELTTRLAEETNRRLYIVSVVTTVVMPATLVVGFFGMNTGGLLWANHNWGTAFAAAVCLVAMLGTLLLMRWKRLL
ncbi:CorA family divalent cation transporter [Rhodovastum atsumiense]|uniref:Magnesium transporter n=1 Tax=Rhodovastum atsumiense TaxID=504468 RepID=A0A5M6ISA0_9PROT|nr:CorA family divalent cation transporter [Rhodovastum atsumiense]KAA5610767.1 magnesium transporter [Rhodovastum atsumiense]